MALGLQMPKSRSLLGFCSSQAGLLCQEFPTLERRYLRTNRLQYDNGLLFHGVTLGTREPVRRPVSPGRRVAGGCVSTPSPGVAISTLLSRSWGPRLAGLAPWSLPLNREL